MVVCDTQVDEAEFGLMDEQLRQDFLNAAIHNNRAFIEERLTGDDTTNEVFLNELLRKAAHYGSISVVELLSACGKIFVYICIQCSLYMA